MDASTQTTCVVDLTRVVAGMDDALAQGAVLARFDRNVQEPVAVAALYPHGLFYATDTRPGCQHWLNYDRLEVRPPDRVVFFTADGRRLACLGACDETARAEGCGVDPERVDDLRTMADEWAAHRALHDGWV